MTIAIRELQRLKDQAKSFRGLMDLYEVNYIRFNYLVHDLNMVEDELLSLRQGDTDLYLRILERCKYTTTVLLTYKFKEAGQGVVSPDMKIRLYHDARQAEVVSCCQYDIRQYQWLDRTACSSMLQWRWRINHFLFKWLGYCLKSGHRFTQQESAVGWYQARSNNYPGDRRLRKKAARF